MLSLVVACSICSINTSEYVAYPKAPESTNDKRVYKVHFKAFCSDSREILNINLYLY